jgi:hypothetical protein
MSLPIPIDHSIAPAHGAGTGVAIAVPGLLSTDTLLAVISTDKGDAGITVAGHNPGAFTAASGSMSSATVDTAGKTLCVVFSR